jgi:hypothetical protein
MLSRTNFRSTGACSREIADRRCARSRAAPIRLPTKSASPKRPLVQQVANLKKIPGMRFSIFRIHHDGLDFLNSRCLNEHEELVKDLALATARLDF